MVISGKIDDISGIFLINSDDGENFIITKNDQIVSADGIERGMFYYASSLISPWKDDDSTPHYVITQKDGQFQCELYIICNDAEEVTLITYGDSEEEAMMNNKDAQDIIQRKYNPMNLHLWDEWSKT